MDILKQRLPKDAFCVLAITMQDLYPEDAWNYVFGQAALRDRVGVYSFARYDPAFYGQPRDDDYEKTLLMRSCRILVHETGHMFGLSHCIYYACVMNGSNNLQEGDAQPLRLCPVCLRKLQFNLQFDVVKRYRTLQTFYTRADFADEADWTRQRRHWIQSAPISP